MSVYPASLMAEAQQMHADGWTGYQIHRILRQRDLERTPSLTTVYLWINPEYRLNHRERHRVEERKAGAAKAKFKLPSDSPEYQLAFIRRLREEQVTWENVARVCRVVFGGRWSVYRVKQLVNEVG